MRFSWRFLAVVLLGAAGVAAWITLSLREDDRADGSDESARRRSAAAETEAFRLGASHFEESARWVECEEASVDRIETFHIELDGKIEREWSRQEGRIGCWYRAPGAFRQETTTHAGTKTQILTGEGGWSIDTDGRVEDLAASPEGKGWMAEIRLARDRFVDVVSFITLRPLRQGISRFRFEGFKRGSGTYAGHWIKLTCRAPGERRLLFWFAYESAGEGAVCATWPGIVRIEDDDVRDPYTEDWLLKEWESQDTAAGAGRRVPRRIEAYTIERDDLDRSVPRRFLFAVVEELQVNEPLEDDLFEPPK